VYGEPLDFIPATNSNSKKLGEKIEEHGAVVQRLMTFKTVYNIRHNYSPEPEQISPHSVSKRN